jgi:hypothetical protein
MVSFLFPGRTVWNRSLRLFFAFLEVTGQPIPQLQSLLVINTPFPLSAFLFCQNTSSSYDEYTRTTPVLLEALCAAGFSGVRLLFVRLLLRLRARLEARAHSFSCNCRSASTSCFSHSLNHFLIIIPLNPLLFEYALTGAFVYTFRCFKSLIPTASRPSLIGSTSPPTRAGAIVCRFHGQQGISRLWPQHSYLHRYELLW